MIREIKREEFGLTEENASRFTAFAKINDRLCWHKDEVEYQDIIDAKEELYRFYEITA